MQSDGGGEAVDRLGVQVASPTEERNERTRDIDALPVLTLLERINDEDATVPGVVRQVLPTLAGLVEVAVERLRRGGRIHYFGAGTSGRLGLLDAAEIPPTYGMPQGVFMAHLAGGVEALRVAREGSEDDDGRGAEEATALVKAADVVIGLTASGYTPYVGGALRASRANEAHTALITSNPLAPLAAFADSLLCVDTGPEVVTGSTRMKSGTAQKLVLNAFSTAVMIRTGRTWSNLMVDMVATNAKLRGRLIRMLAEGSGKDEDTCRTVLADAGGEAKTAVVMLCAGVDADVARAALGGEAGFVAAALHRLASPTAATPIPPVASSDTQGNLRPPTG